MFEYWLDVITMAIQAPIVAYFSAKAIKTPKLARCILVFTAAWTIPYMLTTLMPAVQWIIALIFPILVLMRFSEVKKSFVIFYFIMGVVLMMLFETVFELTMGGIAPELAPSLNPDIVTTATVRIVLEPLLVFVWYLNTRICSKVFHMGESRELGRYMPFVIVEAVVLYVMYLNVLSIDLSSRYLAEVLLGIVIAAFVMIDLLLIRTLRRLEQAHEREAQERTAREILQVQMKNYQFQHERIREFRRIRHDLVNHLQTVQLFLDDQEIDKAKELIGNYSEELETAEKITVTGNEYAAMVSDKK